MTGFEWKVENFTKKRVYKKYKKVRFIKILFITKVGMVFIAYYSAI